MKIVDKYELAKCSYGTPFYKLSRVSSKEFEIDGGVQILTSNTFYSHFDNKPMFNGICELIPDLYDEKTGYFEFLTEDRVKTMRFELFEIDDSSADYFDEDRFLILSKNEFKILLDELTEYYNKLVD